MTPHYDRRLGEILIAKEKVTPAQIESALRECRTTGERIGDALLKWAMVTEDDLVEALSEQMDVPVARPADEEIPEEVLRLAPAKIATRYHVIPVSQKNGAVQVAMLDPMDMHVIDDLRLALKVEIDPMIATRSDIAEAIKKYYGIGAETMEGLVDAEREETEAADKKKSLEAQIAELDGEGMVEDASIVRFVNQIISESIGERATDIHVEPMEKSLRIRYRIDGVLTEAAVPPTIKQFQSAIISRLKIMADMNIAERRLPQDGRIRVKRGDGDFDLRVSSVPTPYGESIAIRILSRDEELVNLDNLGFDPENLSALRDLISRPHGIMLVTGPTGSGKSTTLYAALKEINKVDSKIFTVEDPIEYRMEGITQVQVNSAIGLTFARVLRTLLRQDPDIMMIGEIRDEETAQMAIRAALTGHLVFSTLHTNDACAAVTRLQDMGMEPYLVASSVIGILAQRLVRRLCACKQLFAPPADLLAKVNVLNEDTSGVQIYRAAGCEACRYTGYRGRTAIYEIARLDEEMRRMVINREPANVLKRHAISRGMRPLRQLGWEKAKLGETTLNEVLRVSMEDDTADVI